MDSVTLAYLAGAIDSDGCISIRKSTYHIRVRKDATNPVYSERVMLKQVTPQIPALLHQHFGGRLALDKPSCKANGRPLWSWQTTDRKAARVCDYLLPYLRVKRRQAKLVQELRKSKGGKYDRLSYWFTLEHPGWREMELVTTIEAARLLGHKHPMSVSQAIKNESLLALPYDRSGEYKPRIPRLLVELFKKMAGKDGRSRLQPPQLVEWKERLWSEIREANKIGINGTEVYHQRTTHKPAAV